MNKIVGTDEFWKLMCNIGFRRIDLHEGQIGDTVYHCKTPPELVDGFIDDTINSICKDLKL